MKRINKYVKKRHEIAEYYNNELKDLPLIIPWQSFNSYSSYHLYPICIQTKDSGLTQRQIYDQLIKNNIGANLHYTPVHRHPYYENLGFKKDDFPIAEKFHLEAISIPIYAALENVQREYVVKTLRRLMKI